MIYDICNDYSLAKAKEQKIDMNQYASKATNYRGCKARIYVHAEYNEFHYIDIESDQDFSGCYY